MASSYEEPSDGPPDLPSEPARRPGPLWTVLTVVTSALLFYVGTGFTPVPGLAALAALPPLLLAPRVGGWTASWVALLSFAFGTANSWPLYRNSFDIPVPMAIAYVAGASFAFMLAVLFYRLLLARGRILLAVLCVPAVWVVAWYVASLLSPAGVVGSLATAQADVPLVLQVASVTGAWGVDFVVLLAPSAVAALVTVRKPAVWVAAFAVALIGLSVGYGALRMAGAKEVPQYRVAMIAQNDYEWAVDAGSPVGQQRLSAYVDQIRRIPGRTDLVVLPEGGFRADDETLATLYQPLSEVARERGTSVVVGLVLKTGGRQYNSAMTISADRNRPVRYDRWHDPGGEDTPGKAIAYLPGTRIGLSICGDVDFASPMRDYGRLDTELVAIPSADEDLNGWQHSRTALLRGVENGYGVAWSAQGGSLLAADAWGRVAGDGHTGSGGSHTLVVAELPVGSGTTVYALAGDWFAWLCCGLVLIGFGGLWLRPTSQAAFS